MKGYRLPNGMKALYKSRGVALVVASKSYQAGKRGMHLLNPTRHELEDALWSCDRDCMPIVYVHTELTWPNPRQTAVHRGRPNLRAIQGGAA